MIIASLISIPLVTGLAAFFIPANRLRRFLLVTVALAHTALTSSVWFSRQAPILKAWLELDMLGIFFLSITSILFLAASVYGVFYLSREPIEKQEDYVEGLPFINAPEARFTGCLLLFLSMMTLVSCAQHLGILWVAVETTTLASAPLIYFHRHRRSLEATWKYLLVCSVGIAIALLGNFFLVIAAPAATGSQHSVSLLIRDLAADAGSFQRLWIRAAFLCFIVGYGTKMGLAPMHTWLPDAHSESPSLVSALLSGALLNCALLALIRILQICIAAGDGPFARNVFLGFGIFSMLIATVFILGQTDYKRMLAYSSVEHMGIIAIGIGLGGIGVFGALLQTINHALIKAMLFLTAGNILRIYKTKTASQVSGMSAVMPVSAALWTAGLFAITGAPPFGMFISELLILKTALASGKFAVAAAYLLFLLLIFVGMSKTMLGMVHGKIPEGTMLAREKENIFSVLSPIVLGILTLILGIYLPPCLLNLEKVIAHLGL